MNPMIPAVRSWPKHRLILAALALSGLAAGLAARAALAPGRGVPEPIPYRGVLEQNGAPVTQEGIGMNFELYTAVDQTTAAWAEFKPVNVVDGRFSVQLGDTTPIPQDLLDRSELYLAVTVNGQALVGRQRLLTAPYAHRAGSAWTFRSRDITNDLVPPGTIVAFGGTTAPAGWLACDGAALSIAAYPALFGAIGSTWGTTGAGQFNLPDLRGLFPRGADEGAGYDPGRALGTYQGFATNVDGIAIAGDGAHDHSSKVNSQGVIPYAIIYDSGRGSPGTASDTTAGEPNIYHYWKIDGGEHGHVLQNGASETRPMNAAVKYIIKF